MLHGIFVFSILSVSGLKNHYSQAMKGQGGKSSIYSGSMSGSASDSESQMEVASERNDI